MPSLSEYCTALSKDPAALKEFKSSKEAARSHMVKAGVSERHQEILLRGDTQEITEELETECGPGGYPGSLPTRPGG